jgi:hypothetical protein
VGPIGEPRYTAEILPRVPLRDCLRYAVTMDPDVVLPVTHLLAGATLSRARAAVTPEPGAPEPGAPRQAGPVLLRVETRPRPPPA